MAHDPTMASKCTAEFLGTFILVFTIGCNVLLGNAIWGGVSIACALMVSIYCLGGISGANFNPAVSLALGMTKAMNGPGLDWKTVGIYMAVQTAAGIAAALCYLGLFLDSFDLGPSEGFSWWQAGLCELIYTFMLCFVVLNVAAVEKGANTQNQFYGLAIGFVIVAGAYGAGAVSGGCFNPAVAIGIDVSSALSGFGWCAMYTLCEFGGAALAASLFRVVRPEEFEMVHTGEAPLSATITSEFLGTFMLVLTVGLNVLNKSPAGAFSIAASLMCMIYALGDISGAHFNPAVTVALVASGRCANFTPKLASMYIAVQLAAGVAAAFTYSLILGGASFPLGPGARFGWAEAGIAEAAFTFVLCLVVLCVAVSETTKSSAMFGLAIGSCVTVGGNAIGAISGGSLNPAVSFGIACSHRTILPAMTYTICEVVGAMAATGVFAVTHRVDLSKDWHDASKHSA